MKNRIKLILKRSKIFMWVYRNIFLFGYKLFQNRNRHIYIRNKHLFKDKYGIEIGGWSPVFSENGSIPIYKIAKQLDNINFSNKTFWDNIDEGKNFQFNKNKAKGIQFIADATNLSVIKNDSYEFLISSHVIEHIANPIKAIYEWKRIIKPNGYLAIIAPNMLFTYDRKRPLTQIGHIINDYKNQIEESDNTHFTEIISMHDMDKDGTVYSVEDHKKRTMDNINTRIVHHHTFNMDLLVELLKYCNLKIIDTQSFKPFHLMIIAQKE